MKQSIIKYRFLHNYGTAADLALRAETHLILTAGGNTERMRILNTGNVGIGTNSPSHKLHIKGGTADQLKLEGTSPIIKFTDPLIRSGDGFELWQDGTGSFAYNSTSIARVMTMTSAGNVGIRTTSPGYKLDVDGGDINASGNVRAAGVALVA